MELFSRDTPYGISLSLSGIALLCLGALAFLGLDYHCEGNLLLPIILVVIGMVTVVWSLVKICKAKQNLSLGEGMLKEFTLSVIIMAVVASASLPVGTLLQVVRHKDNLQADIDSTVIAVKTIGQTYQDYARERISDYQRHLHALPATSSAYDTELRGASGTTRSEKVKSVITSLQRRLLNEQMLEVEKQRQEWLDGLHDVSVWNIFTPRNMSAIGNAGTEWVEEYRKVSEIVYSGETAEPFSMPELQDRISQMGGTYTTFRKPDTMSVALTFVGFIFIMTPYFLTRRNTRSKVGTHK